MKRLIILLLIITPFSASGQKITFSSEILNTKDSSVIAVRDLWKLYVTNSQSEASIDYWNKDEIDQGFIDIVKSAFGFSSYLSSELTVFDIKKADNDYYRIRNIWSIGDNNNKIILAIFNVYAKKTTTGYKLYNNFLIIRPKLKHYLANNIDYYYPNNYAFSCQKANLMAELYSKISLLYGFKDKRKVTYIIGNNLDEANSLIGFDYTIYSSSFSDAAYTIQEKTIILASREDYVHEVIHSIFLPKFPKSSFLFQEGIATFYGGSTGRNYSYHINQLRKMINDRPNIDLSKFNDLNKVLDDGTNHFYTIGAIFIDYALKIGGTKKVLALFQSPFANQDTYGDAISAIEKELGIKKDQIDLFLKKYIKKP